MNTRIIKSIFIITIVLITGACKQGSREQTEEAASDILQDEMLELALERGNIIAAETQKTLGSNLKKAVTEGGVQNALNFCNLNAYPLVDSLEQKFNAEIKRASHKTRNPGDTPTRFEADMIAKYESIMAAGNTGDAMVNLVNDNEIIYTKPIVVENALCLNCHGTPGTDILTENYDLIKRLYPEDKAINYKIGDLRGIWSIKFSTASLDK